MRLWGCDGMWGRLFQGPLLTLLHALCRRFEKRIYIPLPNVEVSVACMYTHTHTHTHSFSSLMQRCIVTWTFSEAVFK